jgi:hypothetical protein
MTSMHCSRRFRAGSTGCGRNGINADFSGDAAARLEEG